MRYCLAFLATYLFVGLMPSYAQQQKLDVAIGYLEIRQSLPPTLSNLDQIPEDEGLAGAKLAIDDNNTTGKFLSQEYKLEVSIIDEGNDGIEEAKALLNQTGIVILNANAGQIVDIASLPEAKNAILFNISAREVSLRSESCVPNIMHTIPSRTMLTDALSQFAIKKRWNNWVMIEGPLDTDKAFAQAIERSAEKFRINLQGKKEWRFDADMRRNAAQEVPLFTQDFPDHDMIIIADEANDFARYALYNTWLPRPMAGSEGIVPSAWSASVEQHGAAQLQSRFIKSAGRNMRSVDYAAWAAIRSIGEAVTRTKSDAIEELRAYMLSDKFQLAGFKGRPLTYRNWNGQLRQPIMLAHPGAVVALAPVEGFLHQFNELDTLGIDRPESKCENYGVIK